MNMNQGEHARGHAAGVLHRVAQSNPARRMARLLGWGAIFGVLYVVEHVRSHGWPRPAAIRSQIADGWRRFKAGLQSALHGLRHSHPATAPQDAGAASAPASAPASEPTPAPEGGDRDGHL